ncbi:MAG: LCP family protein [Selenomonadaceae bacterium]|nr:LCP family protein [Selenomonadaceae bacterium]
MGVKGDEFPLQGAGTESLLGFGAKPQERENLLKKNKFFMVMFLLFCFMAAVLAGAYFASHTIPTKKNLPKDETREELLTAKDKTIIMIMGIDPRELEHDVGRSDTLMVATVDPFIDRASLLSIPRDTRVYIPKYGYDKINAAYAYGSERLTKRTVEDFLGISIDHYILIDTRSFVKIIDAIGGVDIDVEKRMRYEDPWDDDGGLHIDLYPGMQHMDGKTAITYVRYRDEEGDIGRIERQQKFMKACMDKLTSPSIITKIPALATEVIAAIKTDLSTTDLIALAGTMIKAQKNGLRTEMVPGKPMYIDEISYWIPDVSDMRMVIAETLGVIPSKEMRSKWAAAEREYESSIPKTAKAPPAFDKSVGREIKPKKRLKIDDEDKDNKKSKDDNIITDERDKTKRDIENTEEKDIKTTKESTREVKETSPVKAETKEKTEVSTERTETAPSVERSANVPTQGASSKGE